MNKIINAGLTTDGRYGNATVDKVKEFQSAYGLKADGQVGTQTVSKMVEVLESMAVVYPSKPSVSVSAGTNRTNTTFNWNACSDTDWYDIRIYDSNNNCISQQFNYNGTSYALTLDAGTYSVDVASVNAKGTYTLANGLDLQYKQKRPPQRQLLRQPQRPPPQLLLPQRQHQ